MGGASCRRGGDDADVSNSHSVGCVRWGSLRIQLTPYRGKTFNLSAAAGHTSSKTWQPEDICSSKVPLTTLATPTTPITLAIPTTLHRLLLWKKRNLKGLTVEGEKMADWNFIR